MSRSTEVRDAVARSYTRAVQRGDAASGSCCSGAGSENGATEGSCCSGTGSEHGATEGSCCSSVVSEHGAPAGSCCPGPASEQGLTALAGYSREALTGLPLDAVVNSFGCGNPIALAAIRDGDTVLDLGSGAGIDLLLAAKLTGPAGKVIGVDMTPAMIERARANAEAAGLENVEVREGIIEQLPVASDSVDLVISNCVINLSPEKHRVFAELHRVLKPGGRISISDIVSEPMPDWVLALEPLHSACLTGAIPEAEYLAGLRSAGLVEVAVQDRLTYEASQLAVLLGSEAGAACCGGSGSLTQDQLARVVEALAGKVASLRFVGRKPAVAQS